MAWKAGAEKMGEGSALIHAAEFDGLATSAAGDHGMVDANLLVRVLKTPQLWVDPAGKLPFEVSGAGPANPTGRGDFRALMEEAVRQGVAVKADTLEELARKAGFTPDFVVQVADYNRAVETGKDPFGKPARFLKFKAETGPFYAARAKVVSLSSLGGVRVNEKFEALSSNYQSVKGLYATGNNAYGRPTRPTRASPSASPGIPAASPAVKRPST